MSMLEHAIESRNSAAHPDPSKQSVKVKVKDGTVLVLCFLTVADTWHLKNLGGKLGSYTPTPT